MSDSVYIEGFSDDVLSSLPGWAKETTLQAILKNLNETLHMQDKHFKLLEDSLKKFVGIASKGSKSGSAGNQQIDTDSVGQLNDDLKQRLKFGEEEAKQENKERKFWKDKNKQATLGEKIFGDMSKKAIALDATLLAFDYISAKGIAIIKENIDIYTKLYNSGINLIDTSSGIIDGFQSLGHIVALSGIRLQDLNNVLQKYSNTVTVFGTQKVVKASNLAYKSLSALGYSAIEGLEFTASYLDSIKGFTDINQLSTQQVANSAIKFGSSMRTLSLETGQSTEALMQKFNALAKSTDAFVLTSQVGATASANLLAFTSSLKDQNLAKQILGTVTAPIKQIDSVVNSLLASGQGKIAQQYMDVTARIKKASEAGASPEELAEIYRQFGSNLKISSAEIQNLQLQNTTASKATLDIINSAKQAARDITPLTAAKKKEIENANRSAQASKRITDAWNKITASVQRLFAPLNGFVDFFASGLEKVANVASWIADKFEGSMIPSITVVIGAITALGLSLVKGAALISKFFGIQTNWMSALGRGLLYIPKLIVSSLFNTVKFIGNVLLSGLGKIAPEIAKSIGSFFKSDFRGVFVNLRQLISQGAANLWSGTKSFFSKGISGIVSDIKSFIPKMLGFVTESGKFFSNVVSYIGNMFGNIGRFFSSIGPTIWNFITGLFRTGAEGILSKLASIGSGILNVFKPFMGYIATAIGIFGRFINVLGWLVTAFQVGVGLGTWLYSLIKDFEWFTKSMDSIFSFLDKMLQYLPGKIGDEAKERIELKKKSEAAEPKKPEVESPNKKVETQNAVSEGVKQGVKETTTVAPKSEPMQKVIVKPVISNDNSKPTEIKYTKLSEPKPTAVNSVSANQPTEKPDKVTKDDNSTIFEPVNTTAKTSNKESELSSLLKYQNILLEQLLSRQSDILSVDRDLLRTLKNS